jgi:hypothetical protein
MHECRLDNDVKVWKERWTLANGRIKLSGQSYGINMWQSSIYEGAPLTLHQCRTDSDPKEFKEKWAVVLAEDIYRIELASAPAFCMSLSATIVKTGNFLQMRKCRSDSDGDVWQEKWIFKDGKIKLASMPGYCVSIRHSWVSTGNSIYMHECRLDNDVKVWKERWTLANGRIMLSGQSFGINMWQSSIYEGNPLTLHQCRTDSDPKAIKEKWALVLANNDGDDENATNANKDGDDENATNATNATSQ